jgi:hypothetical protein
MSIQVNCDCGKEFKVKDELAGKKIKCPACQSVVTVPAGEEEVTAAAPKRPAADEAVSDAPRKRPAPVKEDDLDDEPEPKGGKKKKGKKKNNTMLFVGAGVGVVLLGFCCLGIGAGVWFFVFRTGSPEKVIVGKWKMDFEETRKNVPESEKNVFDKVGKKLEEGMTIEYKSDNTYVAEIKDWPSPIKGKWKMVNSKGSTATLESTQDGSTETSQATVTVISNNRIRVVRDEKGHKEDMVLKRV